MAFKELYNVLESADTMARNLAEQIKNPVKDYSLGLKNEPTTNKS